MRVIAENVRSQMYVDPKMESTFELNNLRFCPEMFRHISATGDDCVWLCPLAWTSISSSSSARRGKPKVAAKSFIFSTGKVNGSLMKCPADFIFSKSEKREINFSCIWLIVLTNRSLCCMSSTSSQASFRSGKWVKSPFFSCAVYSPSFILKLSTQPNRSSTCFPSPWSCRFSLFRWAVTSARKATFVFHSLSLKTGNRSPSPMSLRKWTISGSTARKRCKTFPRLSHLTSLCRMRSVGTVQFVQQHNKTAVH